MKIALTGGTGFIGRYLVEHLLDQGHQLKCWFRKTSRIPERFESAAEWIPGELADAGATERLVQGTEAVVHAALWKPGSSFRGGEGDVVEFGRRNILGTLQLIEAAREAGVGRFVFISTCAVHEKILEDRPLDEAHPLWPLSHYGAHKAAIEKFIHSYGFGAGYPICALRPTGVYGVDEPLSDSKWYSLVRQVVDNQPVRVSGGGKEVHAADVARAAGLLLTADEIAGECFNCYDQYISQHRVASTVKRLVGSTGEIQGEPTAPKHQIETGKLRALGMSFGGDQLLEQTLQQIIDGIA